MTLSTRIGVMNAGEIVQVGEPTQIYENPETRFVADFIGSVNLLEGRVSEDEPEHIRIDSPEIGGTIHVGHGVTCTLDQKVWYAIRPEKMRLTRERPEGEFNLFSAVVEDIGYLGDISVYRLRLPTGKLVSATVANVSRRPDGVITWDERVWVSWEDTGGVVLTR